jgi:glucan-binding YG repeat protein
MPRVRKATTTKTDPQVGSRRSARIRKTEPESGLLPGLEVPEPKKKAVTSKPKPKPKTKPKPKSKATQKKKFVRKADEPENYKAREGVQRHHKWYYLYSNEDEEERLRAYVSPVPLSLKNHAGQYTSPKKKAIRHINNSQVS